MNKIYILVPLTAFALFIGVQQWSQSGRDERDQARLAIAKAAQAAKNAADIQAREAAIAEALTLQARQKKERLEREAREAALIDARDASANERQRLARHIDGLKRDIATEQEAVDRLQIDRDAAVAEQAYLKEFVPKARATAAELERVLKQIAAAEAERAKQTAEAAKKKS
jgi:hypothetical protein